MVKVVTYMSTLMHYAHVLGQARLYGTPEEVERAQRKHDEYARACLESDEIL